jgi:hypothetical protein
MFSFGRGATLAVVALYSCCCLLSQAPGVPVSTADPTQQFMLAQRRSSGYRAKIQNAIAAYEKGLDTHCKDVALDFDSTDVKDKVLVPVYTNEKGEATTGTWRETIPGTACGEKRRFNVQVDVMPDGLEYTATFPGDSAADPDMQKNALKSVELSFHSLGIEIKKNCHFEVLDTHLAGSEPTLQANGSLSPWDETWNLRLCGKLYVVPISYASDGQGTFIKISAAGVRLE